MEASTYLSFENLARVHGTVTASTSASSHPATNLVLPSRLTGWRSTVTTETTIPVDLAAPRQVDRIALIGANFRLFRVEQHTSNSWGAPTYVSGVEAVTRDPDRRIYRRWFERAPSTPLTLRWTRIVIPAQTPLDGAPYFELGTLWMGTFTALPVDPKNAYGREVVRPTMREAAALGGWSVAYRGGPSFVRQRYTRQAAMASGTPGVDDEWAAWMDLDRQIDEADEVCEIVDYWGENRSGVWIMRQTNVTDWSTEWPTATDSWDLEEVVA